MVFNVTKAAEFELENVLETRQNQALLFRIYVRGYGWGGPLFDVGLDEQRETDYAEAFKDSMIIVDEELKERFGGFEIDFASNFFNKGFVVRPNRFASRC